MIDPAATKQLFATYKKHGWLLRRVLLTDPASAGDLAIDVEIIGANIDAAWFSRPPKDGGVAWEIRHLGNVPFALVENLDESHDDFEGSLRNIETRLRDIISAKRQA